MLSVDFWSEYLSQCHVNCAQDALQAHLVQNHPDCHLVNLSELFIGACIFFLPYFTLWSDVWCRHGRCEMRYYMLEKNLPYHNIYYRGGPRSVVEEIEVLTVFMQCTFCLFFPLLPIDVWPWGNIRLLIEGRHHMISGDIHLGL